MSEFYEPKTAYSSAEEIQRLRNEISRLQIMFGTEASKNAKLKKENEELQGYKHVVDTLKAEGFDTVMFVKQELTRYKQYRLKMANEEIALDMEIESRR